MKKNKRATKYLDRSVVLPGLRRFDPCITLRERSSEKFSVLTDGYFQWDESGEEGHNHSLQPTALRRRD
jgi:hypothetical protein